jgi:hypothetical protein
MQSSAENTQPQLEQAKHPSHTTVDQAVGYIRAHGIEQGIFYYKGNTWVVRQALVEIIKSRQGRVSLYILALPRLNGYQGVLDSHDFEYVVSKLHPDTHGQIMLSIHQCFGGLTEDQEQWLQAIFAQSRPN